MAMRITLLSTGSLILSKTETGNWREELATGKPARRLKRLTGDAVAGLAR